LQIADDLVKLFDRRSAIVAAEELTMRCASILLILAGLLAGTPSSLQAGQSEGQGASKVVETYCAGCHNGVTRSPSGAVLDRLQGSAIGDDRDVWTRAYRQLQAGTMPPVGARRPDRPASADVLRAIEAALGVDAAPPAGAGSQVIAERLAALLWNSVPDAPLLDEARRDRLTTSAAVEEQARRMLADERADAFVTRFFFPWLGLDKLANADPDKAAFPDYDVSLRDAMATETDLFLRSQLGENRDPLELWNANYTFVNEALARHYGMAGITGARFRRVPLVMPERSGLLGQGSILMITSRHQQGQPPYTSPAARAMWVRLRFLGAPAPHPFPGAMPVKPELPITPQTRTLPAEPCVNCHRNFFPLGYALENFDPIGRWRARDQAGPVDASGSLVDGTPTDGVVQLRAALLQYPDAFRTNIVEKLLVFASGQPVNSARPTPETLVRARQILRAEPARWASLIAGVVRTNAR
jgi:hypothetical protein